MGKCLQRPQAAPLCAQQVFRCQAHHVEEGCLLGSPLTALMATVETAWARFVGCVVDMLCIVEGRTVERENHGSCPVSVGPKRVYESFPVGETASAGHRKKPVREHG